MYKVFLNTNMYSCCVRIGLQRSILFRPKLSGTATIKPKSLHTSKVLRTKNGTNGEAVPRTKKKKGIFKKLFLGLAVGIPAVGVGTYVSLDDVGRRKVYVTTQGFVRFFR